MIFKPYSRLAGAFLVVGCVAVIAAIALLIGLLAEQKLIYLWVSLGLFGFAVGSFRLYSGLEEQFRYELAERTLFFDRSFFGIRSTCRIASTDDMYCLVARGHSFSVNDSRRSRPGFKYGQTLVLRSGKTFEITHADTTSFHDVMSAARHAAKQFGIDSIGQERRVTKVIGKHPPEIRFDKHPLEDAVG